jgi:hypothetical protein
MTTSKPLFTASFANRDAADAARRELASESSDLLTVLSVFDSWNLLSDHAARKYVQSHYLSYGTLSQMQELRQQYARYLVDSGFLPSGFRLRRGRTPDHECSLAANMNSGNMSLLKAVLCAGLYPNVMVAPRSLVSGQSSQSAGEMAFQSRKKGEIYLHPSTILFTSKRLANRYGCFHEIVKTSKLYVRDCTLVSPVALVLFGGAIEIYHNQGVITIDGWLRFKMPVQQATLLKHLRMQMEKALLQKIVAPDEDVGNSATGKALINSVSLLLGNEKRSLPEDGREIVRPWRTTSDGNGRGDSSGFARGRDGGRDRGRNSRGGRGGRS